MDESAIEWAELLWEPVKEKLQKKVDIKISIPKGKSYMLCQSVAHKGQLGYCCTYGVRAGEAVVVFETYGGEEVRDAINAVVLAAPEGHPVKQAIMSQGKKNKTFLGEIKTKYEDAISVKYAVTTTAQTDSSEAETTGTEPSESDWSNQMPNITNAGTYTVWVKVLQTASEEDADNGENVGSNENANNNEENAKTGEDTENNENTGSEETVVWEETVTSVINKTATDKFSATATLTPTPTPTPTPAQASSTGYTIQAKAYTPSQY